VQRYRRFLQLDIDRQPVGRVGGLLWKSVRFAHDGLPLSGRGLEAVGRDERAGHPG
jgi:hypothetical protein